MIIVASYDYTWSASASERVLFLDRDELSKRLRGGETDYIPVVMSLAEGGVHIGS